MKDKNFEIISIAQDTGGVKDAGPWITGEAYKGKETAAKMPPTYTALIDSEHLVTKLYNEVFTQYAVLRQANSNATTADTVRVKVRKLENGMTLPGYTYTQELQDV